MIGTALRRGGVSLLLLVAGCGLLDVTDPTAIEDRELNNATGAELLRGAALRELYRAAGSAALHGGLLADEFLSDPPAFVVLSGQTWSEEVLDRRQSLRYEGLVTGGGTYGSWQGVRLAATVAIARLREFPPEGAARAHVGEMLAVRAFATLRLAEDICPGFPLNAVVDFRPVYGPPLSTDEAFAHALADFDSAVVYAVDSVRILILARVGRARTLLNLGRSAEAATEVTAVATGDVFLAEYADVPAELRNQLFFRSNFLSLSVADQEGGNGLDFVSGGDPRVRTTARNLANDGVTRMYSIDKYATTSAPLVLASGIEARLIEAEAALEAGNITAWLTGLNDLRATAISPPMSALSDPGTSTARVDLTFRERAFWLFGTGQRLADLRRLVSRYGRPAESVFPTGAYRLGGVYDPGTSIPFPPALESLYNPAVTGCTSR